MFHSSRNSIANITYRLSVSSISSRRGSLLGGVQIEFTGHGFPTNKAFYDITIGGTPCDYVTSWANSLRCHLQQRQVFVSVKNTGSTPRKS